MQSIRTNWGAAIRTACALSSVPPAFLAALIANESGGDANAKRFEKNVLVALWEVLLGRKAAYGSIGRADLVGFVSGLPAQPVSVPASLPADTYQRLDSLATSQGLTQMMGYHVLDPELSIGSMDNLKTGVGNLMGAVKLLAWFAHRYQLDLTADFPPLFACWNSGEPDPAKTFDPQYVSNALTRMKLYAEILQNETDPGT